MVANFQSMLYITVFFYIVQPQCLLAGNVCVWVAVCVEGYVDKRSSHIVFVGMEKAP